VAIRQPSTRVRYELVDMERATLEDEVATFVAEHRE
jgi:hypothetical protein